MLPTLLLASLASLSCSLALPTASPADAFGPLKVFSRAAPDHHEVWKRADVGASGLAARDDATITLSLHLNPANQSAIDELIAELTNEASPRYRQWLSQEEAEALTAPHPDTLKQTHEWLASHGIEEVDAYSGSRTLTFKAPVSKANEMFAADYASYTTGEDLHPHSMLKASTFGTPSLSLPSLLHGAVAFVRPGTDFRQVRRHGRADGVRPGMSRRANAPANASMTAPIAEHVPNPIGGAITSSLQNCWHMSYPNCHRAMYHIPTNVAGLTNGVTIGTLNLRPYRSSDSDMHAGLAVLAPNIPSNYLPPYIEVNVPGETQLPYNGDAGEPNLDLQAVIPLVYPMQVYNFEGPNLNHQAAMVSAQQMGQNGVPRPDVLSVSYGAKEFQNAYDLSLCALTDAVVLQGTTLLASSGDAGSQDLEYPALCPHWVSVGASEIYDGNTVTALEVSEGRTDGWNYAGSGGFSALGLPAPSYQVAALAAYKQKYLDPNYGSLQNNAATPDIAALGRNLVIYQTINGIPGFYRYGGTSASCPLASTIFALINGKRKSMGKGTIGNPLNTLYTTPSLFRDVTSGNNNANGLTVGPWPAATGWDPATGLGTPLYDRMLTYFTSN